MIYEFKIFCLAPPLILMETKNVRETDKNYTLSVDFISLYYSPEVRWFRIMDDQTGEGAQNSKLSIVSYNVTKDNVTFNIPSYGCVFTLIFLLVSCILLLFYNIALLVKKICTGTLLIRKENRNF